MSFRVNVGSINDTHILASYRVGLLMGTVRVVSWTLVDAMWHAQVGARLDGCTSRCLSRVETRFTHLNYLIKLALLYLNLSLIHI